MLLRRPVQRLLCCVCVCVCVYVCPSVGEPLPTQLRLSVVNRISWPMTAAFILKYDLHSEKENILVLVSEKRVASYSQ